MPSSPLIIDGDLLEKRVGGSGASREEEGEESLHEG